jgi:hypothetical protein
MTEDRSKHVACYLLKIKQNVRKERVTGVSIPIFVTFMHFVKRPHKTNQLYV